YLRERRQFGRPIGSFQALQHRAVDAWIQRELASAALAAAVRVHTDPDSTPRERAAAASSAKARAARAAVHVCRTAVQLHDAIGYTDECDVGLYLNRALTLAPFLGNSREHANRFAALASDREAGGVPEEGDAAAGARAAAIALHEPADGDWNSLSDEEF